MEAYAATNATYVSGDAAPLGTLNVGETWIYTASYTLTQADLDDNGGGDGDIDNVATGDSDQTPLTPTRETVPLIRTPALNVTKAATSPVPFVDAAGDVITYEIKVFNIGNTTLTGVSVDDPLLSDEDCDGVAGAPYVKTGFTISVGGSLTCTGSYTVTQADIDNNGGGDGDIDNTVTADSDQTDPDTASASVPLEQTPGLNVTKAATSRCLRGCGR